MVNVNAKEFRAVSVVGGYEEGMTLEEARNQAQAWGAKGYESFVENMYDPEWEEMNIVAPITPFQVVESLGADRVALQDFVLKLVELLDWEYAEQDGGFVVYTTEAD